MSRYSNSGTKENHSRLSHWSKESIREILQDFRMSYCLHNMKTSFCGDGIVQSGEVKNFFIPETLPYSQCGKSLLFGAILGSHTKRFPISTKGCKKGPKMEQRDSKNDSKGSERFQKRCKRFQKGSIVF